MGTLKRYLDTLKVGLLTLIVVVSFIMSSFGWRHIESSETQRILVAGAILLTMYVLMIFELVNRNLAALIGAAASVAAYDCLVEYIEMEQILRWEDLETLALLFGMMTIVNILGCSGLFDYLAIWSYKKSAGRFWSLIVIMSLITGFLSAFIDNVSTMLLISPTLIKLSELEHIDPRYMLMIMVIFCNIGGCATPVGDPPNLIIIGDDLISQLGITFSSFVAYCGPGVLITIAIQLYYLKLKYKSKDSFRLKDYTPFASDGAGAGTQALQLSLRHSVGGADSGNIAKAISKNELKIRELTVKLKTILQEHSRRQPVSDKCVQSLEKQIELLEHELNGAVPTPMTPAKGVELVKDNYEQMKHDQLLIDQANSRRNSRLTDTEIVQLFRRYSIKSRPILVLSLTVLLLTTGLFFIQSLPGINLTLGWISLFAGLTLLVASSSIEVGQSDKNKNDDDCDKQEDNKEADNSGNLSIVSVVTGAETTTNSRASSGSSITASNVGQGGDCKKSTGSEQDNFEFVISRIEWSTLMFFFSLFIVMEVMEKLGLIKFVGSQIVDLVELIPVGPMRSIGAITVILWASGLASACIDNVPFTSMMIKVLGSIALNSGPDLNIKSLVFALSFGACYGGNGTLIGASANLVTAGLAGRHNYPISFNQFFKFAAPATILSLIIANIYLVVVFVFLGL